MFLRRLYYDLTTGAVVSHRMAQGDIYKPDPSDDFARLPELTGRSASDTGLMQWDEPDETVESRCAAGWSVSVDVSQTPPALVWTEPEPVDDTGMGGGDGE